MPIRTPIPALKAGFCAAVVFALGAAMGHAQGADVVRAEAFETISAALADVWAIDNHTHIVYDAAYNEAVFGYMPLAMRQAVPEQLRIAAEMFGTEDPAEAAEIRNTRIVAEGGDYWVRHLDATQTRIALVNTMRPVPDTGGRLLQVPFASYLLFPVPAEGYAHNPAAAGAAGRAETWLAESVFPDGERPADLAGYLALVDETLAGWSADGIVAVKFVEGLTRPLAFSDTTEAEAAVLYEQGLAEMLGRSDYHRLQDFLVRHIFLAAPQHDLAVHIHLGASSPPFLRLQDNDVGHLENILTDPRFFGTEFVLIHAGFPMVEEAAYQALKPNIWLDVSALAFFYPMPELVAHLRTCLIYAPTRTLFGTDVSSYPGVPGGPEVQHVLLSRVMREALNHALAGLVRDGLVTTEEAIEIGRGVLQGNAARLYGFNL